MIPWDMPQPIEIEDIKLWLERYCNIFNLFINSRIVSTNCNLNSVIKISQHKDIITIFFLFQYSITAVAWTHFYYNSINICKKNANIKLYSLSVIQIKDNKKIIELNISRSILTQWM